MCVDVMLIGQVPLNTMEPVFPNQQQNQWAQQPPGGVWTPPQPEGHSGGVSGGDYNVNLGGGHGGSGGAGGQFAMPFDPSTLDQPAVRSVRPHRM